MAVSKARKIERQETIKRLAEILEPWVPETRLLDELEEQTNLIADLGLDSVGLLQVILTVEKDFGIVIDERELDAETFSAVGNLVSFIEKKLNENN